MSQLPKVSTQYGAPMGRHTVGHLDTSRRSVRLFRVRLDAGGYDDGGAYWGHGQPLWCAIDRDGDMQFTRALARNSAAFMLEIPNAALRIRLSDYQDYVFALYDGRCPFPTGKDRADLDAWVAESNRIAKE